MNQKDFTRKVASVLKQNDARKKIPSQKHVLHISDDIGNSKDFIIKKDSRGALFSIEDVDMIMKACIDVALDCISKGDNVSIQRIGTLGLHYTKGRTIKNVHDGSTKIIPDRYVPKFSAGKELRMCAKVYEMNLEENKKDRELIESEYGDYLEDEGVIDD